MSTGQQGDTTTLASDVLASATVTEHDGYYKVNIPKDAGDAMRLSDGDQLTFAGERGADRVEIIPGAAARSLLLGSPTANE